VDASGAIRGTVGGGAVEAEAQRQAAAAIRHSQPVVFDFPLQGASLADGRPICGGVMRLLVDPAARHQHATWAAAAEARRNRQTGVLLTQVEHTGAPTVVLRWLAAPGLDTADFPGVEAIRSALRDEEARHFTADSAAAAARVEVLVEPVLPRPQLLIVGGGHVGQAVARQASLVGFDITVLDDREEFTQPALFPPGTVTRCGPIARELAAFAFTPDTYVVLVTRGAAHDAEALAVCLPQPLAYLGMIGSRRKVALVRREFLAAGRATEAELDRVYAPIGLDLGAVTVPEIAASIVAQLIAVRRTGRASRMPGA
jgi:xanthine dehydrogenase accessory factor